MEPGWKDEVTEGKKCFEVMKQVLLILLNHPAKRDGNLIGSAGLGF